MVDDFRTVAAELERIAAARSDQALAALAKSIRDLQTRVLTGMGTRSAWDVQTLNQLISMTQGAIRDSGLAGVADHFGDAAVNMAQKVDGIAVVTLGAKEANYLTAAVQARFDGWHDSVTPRITNYIRDRLIQNGAAPVPTTTLADDLMKFIVGEDGEGGLESYAGTYIETAMHQQLRDTWAQAGENMGAEIYRYSGPPLINTSHEFCIEHYEEERPQSEWEAMDNGTDIPVWTGCGGWGCRHVLEPIPP